MRTIGTPTPSKSPKPSGKPKAATKKKKSSAASSKKKTSAIEETKIRRGSKRKRHRRRRDAFAQKIDARADADQRRARADHDQPRRFKPAAPRRSAPEAESCRQPTSRSKNPGIEEEQGFAPPPPPPPQRSFWERLFGGGRNERSYRYLSRSVIDAIRRAPVQRSRWKFIIVHNSGTRQGNAKAFDYYHRKVRRMQNGMAYHFVVGNGRSSGDGEIEIGNRWTRQINGGHVHSDYLNNISLGICLVGDFNRDQPTRAQLEATEELIKYLRERCGKADGRAIPVRPHREMNPPR